jgi:ElaB/YqjD/DUF883 family membrane-anchored ribosome-binding protein
MNRASGMAQEAGDYATRAASSLASEAQGKVSGLLQGQIEAGANYVSMMSETANSAARDLDDKAPELARLLRDVASRTDRFADNLRHRSADEMMDMAASYARENPRVFFGGAIAIGFLLSRFLKSSAPRGSYGGSYGSRQSYGAGSSSRGGYGAGSSGGMSGSGMSGSGAAGSGVTSGRSATGTSTGATSTGSASATSPSGVGGANTGSASVRTTGGSSYAG